MAKNRPRGWLDPEVMDWLHSKGEGHLTRINDTLTNVNQAKCLGGAAEGEWEVASLVMEFVASYVPKCR